MVKMLGDPRDQIGDLHRIDDPDGVGESIYALVQGYRRTWSPSEGLLQDVTYRVVQQNEPANTYRIFGEPGATTTVRGHSDDFTFGHEFYVTSTSWLTTAWFYRFDTSITMEQMRLYRVDSSASGTPVPDTHYSIDSSGATGWRGFVFPAPVLLDHSQPYRMCFYFSNGNYNQTAGYWSTGAGSSGHVNGPLVMPSSREALGGMQASFHRGTGMAYPNENLGSNPWIDVTVADSPR